MKQQLKNLGQHLSYTLLSLLILTPLLAYGLTQYRNLAIFSSTINSTTIGATTPSSIAGTTLQVNTGLTSGPGIQYLHVTSCTTSGANGFCQGGPTTGAFMNWPVPFADTNYAVICSVESNTLYLANIQQKTAAGILPTVQLTFGNSAAASGPVDCLGIHMN